MECPICGEPNDPPRRIILESGARRKCAHQVSSFLAGAPDDVAEYFGIDVTEWQPQDRSGFEAVLNPRLQERGMLDTTLVCWMTDFGRTPTVNSASGRDHWSASGFAIMAGAGVPGGHVLGETTSDGGAVAKDEYLSADIATTIYMKLGIPHDLIAQSPDGRPVRLIEGHPIKEWM